MVSCTSGDATSGWDAAGGGGVAGRYRVANTGVGFELWITSKDWSLRGAAAGFERHARFLGELKSSSHLEVSKHAAN